MTRLRRMMLEELERRNYSAGTIRYYVGFVERFAKHFGKSPDKLGPDHVRTYRSYLLQQRKLSPGTVEHPISALRFFYVQTLHRYGFRQFLPYPRVRQKLAKILSREEVAQLIEASSGLFERTLRMVLYGTGMRRAEVARLKIADIDGQRMILHVVNGKGGKDRDLPLSPALLETLRAYWRWLKPRIASAALPRYRKSLISLRSAETPDSASRLDRECLPYREAIRVWRSTHLMLVEKQSRFQHSSSKLRRYANRCHISNAFAQFGGDHGAGLVGWL